MAGAKGRGRAARAAIVVVTMAALVALVVDGSTTATGALAGTRDEVRREVRRTVGQAVDEHDLRAIIVRVTANGRNVYTGARGESMTGVPASPTMQFRNGAMALTYLATIVLQLVDEGAMRLEDRVARWMPELPAADRVTVRNLLDMTSGYADYVYQPEVFDGIMLDPFRQWSGEELIRIGVEAPMVFEPGTNWAYSHTNYVILGRILERVTGQPLARVMQERIVEPMGLEHTSGNDDTPAIPEPVLHAFTSERRETLGIPPGVAFTEDATFWNPSWTTAPGAVQTTDVRDMTRSMELVGRGTLLSRRSHRLQIGNHLAGFGEPDPSGRCAACARLTNERSYGLGVVLRGPWITQTKSFAGSSATTGYLPSEDVAITVVTTYAPDAFDDTGAFAEASTAIFAAIAAIVVPEQSSRSR